MSYDCSASTLWFSMSAACRPKLQLQQWVVVGETALLNKRLQTDRAVVGHQGETRGYFLCKIWPTFFMIAVLCNVIMCLVKFHFQNCRSWSGYILSCVHTRGEYNYWCEWITCGVSVKMRLDTSSCWVKWIVQIRVICIFMRVKKSGL